MFSQKLFWVFCLKLKKTYFSGKIPKKVYENMNPLRGSQQMPQIHMVYAKILH